MIPELTEPERSCTLGANEDHTKNHMPSRSLIPQESHLCDVCDLATHVGDLLLLKVQHLDEVVGQGVYLISDARQTLGGEVLSFFKSSATIF